MRNTTLHRLSGVVFSIGSIACALPSSAEVGVRDIVDDWQARCWGGQYEPPSDADADIRSGETALEIDDCAVTLEPSSTDSVSVPLRAGFPLSGVAEKSAHLRIVYASGEERTLAGELWLDNEGADTPWITVVFPDSIDVTSIKHIYVSQTMPLFCANPVHVKSCAQFRDEHVVTTLTPSGRQ